MYELIEDECVYAPEVLQTPKSHSWRLINWSDSFFVEYTTTLSKQMRILHFVSSFNGDCDKSFRKMAVI